MGNIDIDRIFSPNKEILKWRNDTLTTEIVDAEVDVIKCKFYNDDCVELITKPYSYITLTRDNLETLINLIDKAEIKYKKKYKKESNNLDCN